MATFKNFRNSTAMLTDENGNVFKWDPKETRSGLSNYFYNYTSGGGMGDKALLALVGDLDNGGVIPAPAITKENIAWATGASDEYPHTRVAGEDLKDNSNAPRTKRVVWDATNESSNEFRRIDTRFVGVKGCAGVRVKDETNTAIADTNAQWTADLDGESVPFMVDGLKATAADAAANPTVTAGSFYTAFGTMTVTDATDASTSDIYFSVVGEGTHGSGATFVFAEEDDFFPVGVPGTLTDCIIDVDAASGTDVFTFGALDSADAADSVAISVSVAKVPDSVDDFSEFNPDLDDGIYFAVSGSDAGTDAGDAFLYVVKNGVVSIFNSDLSGKPSTP